MLQILDLSPKDDLSIFRSIFDSAAHDDDGLLPPLAGSLGIREVWVARTGVGVRGLRRFGLLGVGCRLRPIAVRSGRWWRTAGRGLWRISDGLQRRRRVPMRSPTLNGGRLGRRRVAARSMAGASGR